MEEHGFSRRRFIRALAGAGAVGAIGAGGAMTLAGAAGIAEMVHETLGRHLPGVAIARADVESFVRDFLVRDGQVDLKARTMRAFDVLARGAARLSPFIARKIDNFERRLLTDFLLNSDFFVEGAQRKAVKYFGQGGRVCATANPFARFLD